MNEYNKQFESKVVVLVRIEPNPKINIYNVQPQFCYLPNYENHEINIDNKIVSRVFELEEETILEEIPYTEIPITSEWPADTSPQDKILRADDISNLLVKKGIPKIKTEQTAQTYATTEDL